MKHNYHTIVAIDIAKENLQGQIEESSLFSFSNDSRGFSRLYQRIKGCIRKPLVVCESTGGYERALLAFLHSTWPRADPDNDSDGIMITL